MSQLTVSAHAAFLQARSEPQHQLAVRDVARHYRIGPVPVSLYSEDPQIADAFHDYYEPYQVFAPSSDSFRIEVLVRRSWRSLRRYYHIQTNGREQCILKNSRSVLPFVEWTMNALVAKFLPGYLQIHAASMSYRGRGVILAGSPGQGKSTLAAGLLARGWSYLSDEFALIDPDHRTLEAYPKALCIKAGSFEPVRQLGLPLDLDRVLHKGSKGPVSLIDPLKVRANAVGNPCPVRMIIFPQYEAGAEPDIQPMSRAQAVFELVQASFNFTKFRNRGLQLLAEIARNAHCVRVRSGDLSQTARMIEEYMESDGQLPGRHA